VKKPGNTYDLTTARGGRYDAAIQKALAPHLAALRAGARVTISPSWPGGSHFTGKDRVHIHSGHAVFLNRNDHTWVPAPIKAAVRVLHSGGFLGVFDVEVSQSTLSIDPCGSGAKAPASSPPPSPTAPPAPLGGPPASTGGPPVTTPAAAPRPRSSFQGGSAAAPARQQLAQQMSSALKGVPWPVWERVVREEPEFQHMMPLSQRYPPGPFLTLMVMAGLNDYQLRGKAEVAYWPPLAGHLERATAPSTPNELATLLEAFYARERFKTRKVRRLRRFLGSALAEQLWQMTPVQTASQLNALWQATATAMGQEPSDKTIAFAAKTLVIALLLLGETGFDFSGIPLPVDQRLQGLTPHLDDESIRRLWDAVLGELRKCESRLTHVHLDSFLWQYAGARDRETYLRQLGVPPAAATQIVSVL